MQVHNPTTSDIEAGWISIKAGETVVVTDELADKAFRTWGFLVVSPEVVVPSVVEVVAEVVPEAEEAPQPVKELVEKKKKKIRS